MKGNNHITETNDLFVFADKGSKDVSNT